MNKIIALLVSYIALFSVSEYTYCQSSHLDIKKLSQAYFQTYAERENWEAFLSFYDNDIYFEDIQFRLVCAGIDSFSQFYDWPNSNFQKVDSMKPILKVEQLITNDSSAIAHGFFDSFYWQNNFISGPWEFTIILNFNSEGKIIRQRDMINYPLYFLCGNQKLERDIDAWMERKRHLVQQPEK